MLLEYKNTSGRHFSFRGTFIEKEDLKNILKNLKPEKYQLEFATNKYMMMNNKKVYWMPSSALNTWPTTKFGFAIGMNKIISMNQNILTTWFVNYLKQLLFSVGKIDVEIPYLLAKIFLKNKTI